MGIIMKLWIARDENGYIFLYRRKPYITYNPYTKIQQWILDNGDEDYMMLSRDYFPEVTFENSPQEVELKLINKL